MLTVRELRYALFKEDPQTLTIATLVDQLHHGPVREALLRLRDKRVTIYDLRGRLFAIEAQDAPIDLATL